MARLKVGILGLGHDHVWGNLAALSAGGLGQAVAAADPDPQLRERLEQSHAGVERHATYDALLERTDLDAVFVYADNRTSVELGARALGRGLPVMVVQTDRLPGDGCGLFPQRTPPRTLPGVEDSWG